jgi:hypothetical protein
MGNLFQPVKEGHDGKGRVLFICVDQSGYYVYKPQTGFRTKHWKTEKNKELIACFKRQVGCTQNAGFLEPNEVPAADEDYTLKV